MPAPQRWLIRAVVRDGDGLISLCVVDDGRGVEDEPTIDRAMTVGGRRDYDASDLGHFGIGLKAASVGQARELTVGSRAKGDVLREVLTPPSSPTRLTNPKGALLGVP